MDLLCEEITTETIKRLTANPALLPEEEWYDVDVITCAAPNLRENPSNGYNQGDGSARVIKLHEKLHEKTKCS